MSEIIEALNQLEKEKNISKDILLDAIERSLKAACKKDFDTDENINVVMDRETGEFHVYAQKEVVEEVERMATQISLEQAKMIKPSYELGDIVNIEITTKDFGRIAAQRARNVIVQAINESERDAIYDHFYMKEKDIVTGIVQRRVGDNVNVSLDDKTEAILKDTEMVPGETYNRGDRIKLYVTEVKKSSRGPRITVSRTHPDLVKRLFEKEVTEIADGTVEIKSSCREAGSRSKIAVWSNDENVDPVGACVGVNGARVNAVVEDLNGEKIDIICWDENPAIFIKNALSPSEVIAVDVDLNEKSAFVVVPDFQLSLAIGKKGQNARLAAKLTGYKIDIKSESQAEEMGYFSEEESYEEDYDAYDEPVDEEGMDEE
ncbi:MAG: transcription termination/antitermination protein NusA [Coprococcus sp.]|nr:transcription termination/antitermination protein NusA [Coprococcus sp.]